MNRVAINRKDIDFLVVMEYSFADERTSAGYVAISQDNAVLCIYDES